MATDDPHFIENALGSGDGGSIDVCRNRSLQLLLDEKRRHLSLTEQLVLRRLTRLAANRRGPDEPRCQRQRGHGQRAQ